MYTYKHCVRYGEKKRCYFVFVCCFGGVQINSAPVSIDQSDVVNKTPKAMGTNHVTPCARDNCKFMQ